MASEATLLRATLQSDDPHLVVIQRFGVPRDLVGEDTQLVVEALCDDIEVPVSFQSGLFHFSANVPKTSVHFKSDATAYAR